MMTVAQFASLKLVGPTRSFICAVPELPELPLTPNAFPKLSQAFAPKTPAPVRSIPASPNSLVPSVSLEGATVSETGPNVFTFASANPRSVTSVAGPQHGGLLLPTSHEPEVTHRLIVITGVSPAPPSKSYTTSMSPRVRWTRPSDEAPHGVSPLLNSNPTCAEGDVVFCG